MRVCDFCARRETSVALRHVEYLLRDADQESGVIDRVAWDVCDSCIRQLREAVRSQLAPVKSIGQWEAAMRWKEKQFDETSVCKKSVCKKCGRAGDDIEYYVQAAGRAGVSVSRYLFFADFVCPDCC